MALCKVTTVTLLLVVKQTSSENMIIFPLDPIGLDVASIFQSNFLRFSLLKFLPVKRYSSLLSAILTLLESGLTKPNNSLPYLTHVVCERPIHLKLRCKIIPICFLITT
jgi:hypothetical protein